jgi:hypothetical protein
MISGVIVAGVVVKAESTIKRGSGDGNDYTAQFERVSDRRYLKFEFITGPLF